MKQPFSASSTRSEESAEGALQSPHEVSGAPDRALSPLSHANPSTASGDRDADQAVETHDIIGIAHGQTDSTAACSMLEQERIADVIDVLAHARSWESRRAACLELRGLGLVAVQHARVALLDAVNTDDSAQVREVAREILSGTNELNVDANR